MRTKREHKRRLIAAVAAVALVAAACGDDDDETGDTGTTEATGETGDTAETAPGGSFSDLDLSGTEFTVGSKDFVENRILGAMAVVALEEAGASVTDDTDLGGTNINRDALESGEIDMYPDYNGTGYTNHLSLGDDVPGDPVQLYEEVRDADLEENGIHWLTPSEFNNTYGFASRPDLTADDGGPFDMQGMADYLAENENATLCLESEFPDRPDGLTLFEQATEYEVPASQVSILDIDLVYTETADGNCDFGEVFTTDSRIPGLGLHLVEDPGVMIIYNASWTVRDEAYQQAPEELDMMAESIFSGLDNETMTDLNARVDEGSEPIEVAREYLEEEGLIG